MNLLGAEERGTTCTRARRRDRHAVRKQGKGKTQEPQKFGPGQQRRIHGGTHVDFAGKPL